MMPFYVVSRAWVGFFDPRYVTLAAMALAALLYRRSPIFGFIWTRACRIVAASLSWTPLT